jgi:hypothetical protein
MKTLIISRVLKKPSTGGPDGSSHILSAAPVENTNHRQTRNSNRRFSSIARVRILARSTFCDEVRGAGAGKAREGPEFIGEVTRVSVIYRLPPQGE